jgi:asparagine synthase (glutamine-hydrolysing)
VLLARDRMGKKPLFYWYAKRALAFASELKALRILPGFPTEIDPEALGLYLRIGFVPTDFCIHPGVFKLPPASYLLWEVGRPMPAPVPYWRLPHEEPAENKAEAPWVDDIQHALWDAARIRLRSDVPVGVFLSSGIDSGLVAAAAAVAFHWMLLRAMFVLMRPATARRVNAPTHLLPGTAQLARAYAPER